VLKQMRSPGFIPSAAPSTTVAVAGMIYLQVLQAAGAAAADPVETVSIPSACGSGSDSFEQAKNAITTRKNTGSVRLWFVIFMHVNYDQTTKKGRITPRLKLNHCKRRNSR
jgi:hypothetical protein